MRDDKEPDIEEQGGERPKPLAGYAAESKAALDQRASAAKFNRHTTRVLPTPIALRAEYKMLANNPKCGKRGAIGVLAKKYHVSQAAVQKALEKKTRKI